MVTILLCLLVAGDKMQPPDKLLYFAAEASGYCRKVLQRCVDLFKAAK